jgi:hypothetical protein
MGGSLIIIGRRIVNGRHGFLPAVLLLLLLPPSAFAASDTPASVHPDEYAVYSAVLRHGLAADTPRVVVAKHTAVRLDLIEALRVHPNAVLAELAPPPAVLEDFVIANKDQTVLEPQLDLAMEYVLLDNAEINTAFGPEGWKGFYTRYPGAPGVVRVSRIGFDTELQHALVMIEQICGSECGAGRLVYLSRVETGSWRVLAGELIWVAGPARQRPEMPAHD